MAKEYIYMFRWEGTKLAITKCDEHTNDPLLTYYITGNVRGRAYCDCPASMHRNFDPDTHKHILWAKRWIAIQDENRPELDGVPIYYSTRDDSFHTMDGVNVKP